MKKYKILFIVSFVSILLSSIVTINMKKDFFVDEIWTYAFSNGNYTPHTNAYTGNGDDIKAFMEDNIVDNSFINTVKNAIFLYKGLYIDKDSDLIEKWNSALNPESISWKKGQDFKNTLVPSEDSKFNYYSVYCNDIFDNHPILYYGIYHTISSLTPDVFTKWTGFIINVAFLLPAIIMLFFMTKKFFDDKIIAYGTFIAYGLSIGFLSTIVFFRMYAMVTFFTIATLYLHLCFLSKPVDFKFKHWLLLVICVSFGVLSQYFYIFYCFAIFVVSAIYLLRNKNLPVFFKYCSAMFAAVIFVLIIWPFTIEDLFFSSRGQEAMSQSFSVFGYLIKLLKYMRVVLQNCFGNNIIWLGLFTIITLFCIFKLGKKIKIDIKRIIIYVPIVITLLIVTQMAPYQTSRYIMNLFPLIFIFVADVLYIFISNIKEYNSKKILIVFMFCISFLGFLTGKPEYLYTENVENNKIIDSYSGYDCISVMNSKEKIWRTDYAYIDFTKYDDILAIAQEDIKRIDITPISDNKEILLYIDNKISDKSSVINSVKEVTGFKTEKLLISEYKYSDIYVLYK